MTLTLFKGFNDNATNNNVTVFSKEEYLNMSMDVYHIAYQLIMVMGPIGMNTIIAQKKILINMVIIVMGKVQMIRNIKKVQNNKMMKVKTLVGSKKMAIDIMKI